MHTGTFAARRARRHGLIALAVANAIAGTAMAQDASGGADVPEESSLDTVVVTGSRATGRTVRNSAAPIDVVSSDALQATGKGNLLDALQSLLPSFNSAAKQSDVEGNIPGVQLRNLSPGYTLVLVNGKRRNNSAYTSVGTFPGQSYTDLSLIPVSAIDHVEVLRDGASAIYGSDAIAGVFNVILKSDARSGGLGIEYGRTYIGDVSVEELKQGLSEIVTLLDDLSSGFRVLADLRGLDRMDPKCAKEIGKAMELCDQKGVGLVVRIIPDPQKDIGMKILSIFHYRNRPRIVTCETLVEAGEVLGLGPGRTNDSA